MSAEKAAMSRSWAVGRRVCTLTVPNTGRGELRSAVVEWAPETPHKLSAAEWVQYRAGRDAAVTALAQAMGIKAMVIDL